MLYFVTVTCPECNKAFLVPMGGFINIPLYLKTIICKHCGHEFSMFEKLKLGFKVF